jgi:hypothetical protein
MRTYKQRKDAAREAAIELQGKLREQAISWQESAEICTALYRCGRRYGLLTEFRENGLI